MKNTGRNILIIAMLIIGVIVIAMFMSMLKGFFTIHKNNNEENISQYNILMNL